MHMLVKICGITNLEDALLAAELGADKLGFNFYENSSRFVNPLLVAKIADRLPADVGRIGVFVNEQIERIAEIAEVAKLDGIQLHGTETPQFASRLMRRTRLTVIKAFQVSRGFTATDVNDYDVDAILLDTYRKDGFGGSGEVFDWKVAIQVKQLKSKMYLAGGLSESNVSKAIADVGPYCVDACSRLESAPGKKDEVKLRHFLRNAGKAI